MSGKNLTFKLVMDADTKDYVSNTKQAQDVTVKVFDTIKSEAQKVKVTELVQGLHEATKEITDLGDKSSISGTKIREMSMQSQKMVASLSTELVEAQAELVRLSQSKASPTDLSIAINRVADLKSSIRDVEAAFGAYQSVATNAMAGVDKATSSTIAEVQKFTSVDLSNVVGEAQNATRAIESMGDGATASAKDIERIEQLGVAAIDSLERELLAARNAWKALVDASDDVTLEELNAAKERVTSLERALNLADNSMSEFRQATQQTSPSINELDQSLDRTNQELSETETLTQRASNEIQGLKTGFNALTGALAALGIGTSAMEIAQTADSWANLNARLKIAVDTHGDVKVALNDVLMIARETNTDLVATGDLYARLTKIGQEMSIPQNQVLQLTKTINQAIQVSGGSAESTEAAVFQLQQSLSSGRLAGEEFNSIAEQSPRLLQALAEGLGVTTGKLRIMAGEGKLTSEVVTKALLSQSETIQKEFDQFPTTIGNSITNLKTSWMEFIGNLDQTHNVSAKVAESLSWIAKNLDTIFTTLTLAAQAFIAYKALNIANTFFDKAAGVRAASVAVTQETASVVTNTQAQLANAAATRATTAAKAQLATTATATVAANAATGSSITALIGRLGSLGVAITAVGVLVPTVFEPIGTYIGEGVAKLQGYDEALKKLEQQELLDAARAKVVAESKAEIAAAAEKGREKAYQLTEQSKKLVAEFNELIKKGEPTKEALEKISNAMKFDSTKGINDSVTALILLKDQGKITGDELQASLSKGLDGKDLLVFQTNAKAAFAGTAQEATKSAAVTEAVMRAALERTGLETQQLKGSFSSAFQSASNDVQIVIENLDAYKAQGIDTGLALATNLNKAIDTAQTRAELDYAKSKLLELEKQGVITGEQVALGLSKIEKKATQLPEALNPAIAAFAALGIKTKEQLNDAAIAAQKNFDVVSKSGQATAEGIKQAYTEMLNAAIATGDKARIAQVQAKAASQGLQVQIDETGKASVKSMDDLTSANKRVGDSARSAVSGYRELGDAVRQEAKSSIEAWNEMMDARSKAEKENKTQRVGADFTTYNVSDIQSKLSGMGYNETEAAKIAKNILNQALEIDKDKAMKARLEGGIYGEYNAKAFEKLIAQGQTSAFGTQKVNELLARYMAGQGSAKTGTTSAAVNALAPEVNVAVPTATVEQPSTKTVTYNLSIGGKTVEVSGDESSQVDMNAFMNELERLKKGM